MNLNVIFVKKCNFIADGNKSINLFFCRFCKTGKHVKTVIMPFTSKLMIQELNATGIKVGLGLTVELKKYHSSTRAAAPVITETFALNLSSPIKIKNTIKPTSIVI